MNRENLKEIIQQKTVPWLFNARSFESQTLPENTPDYILKDRQYIIDRDKKIEEKIREYAPHAGVALDFATESNALEFGGVALAVLGTLGAGTLATIWTYFKRSDADKVRHEHAKLDAETATRQAIDAGKTETESIHLGEIAYQKSMGTFDRIQLIKKGVLVAGVLGGGFLLLKIIQEFKR